MALRKGEIVGNWRVLGRINEGGMASVWRVEHTTLRTIRALKLPHGHVLKQIPGSAERFLTEARHAFEIDHPNVVRVFDAGEMADVEADRDAPSIPWMVMELLDGHDLSKEMEVRGMQGLPVEEVTSILMQVGAGLGAAHDKGVVHLDLKPENIVLAKAGDSVAIKVVDFGISKAIAPDRNSVTLTQLLLTPLWTSPEQLQMRTVARGADVWALGLIAFHLLTGRYYWESGNGKLATGVDAMSAMVREVIQGAIVPASERASALMASGTLPMGFDVWFAKCLEQEPAQRFADARVCVHELANLLLDGARLSPSQAGTTVTVAGVPFVRHTGTMPMPTSAVPNANHVPALVQSASVHAATQEATRPHAPAGFTATVVSTPLRKTIVDPQLVQSMRRWKPIAASVVGFAAVVVLATRACRGSQPVAVARAELSTSVSIDSAAVLAPPTSSPPPPAPRCPSDMSLIPAGQFVMGSPDGRGRGNEHPLHRVQFAQPFCVDRAEVSVASYRACVNDGNYCSAPNAPHDTPNNYDYFCNWGRSDAEDHPVNCVDWMQAKVFCEWSGHLEGARRLPREAEWEYAARGTGNNGAWRTYPWLTEVLDEAHANLCGHECWQYARDHGFTSWSQIPGWDDGYHATAPVSSFAEGATPEGLLNMVGNVWEWVDDEYAPDAYARHDSGGHFLPVASETSRRAVPRVNRGGGWFNFDVVWGRASLRDKDLPTFRHSGLGFRCAREAR